MVPPDRAPSDAASHPSLIASPSEPRPALLLHLLAPFADRHITPPRVDSRPSGERLGDYVFHIDVAAGLYEQRTQDAIAAVEALADEGWVRRLGSYDSETVLY